MDKGKLFGKAHAGSLNHSPSWKTIPKSIVWDSGEPLSVWVNNTDRYINDLRRGQHHVIYNEWMSLFWDCFYTSISLWFESERVFFKKRFYEKISDILVYWFSNVSFELITPIWRLSHTAVGWEEDPICQVNACVFPHREKKFWAWLRRR